MRTTLIALGLFTAAGVAAARAFASLEGSYILPVDDPAIRYNDNGTRNAVAVLQAAFTGPIARGLSLVAIVVGGIMFAFGEGDSKRMLAGIVFGVGMAVSAVNFMVWLFP